MTIWARGQFGSAMVALTLALMTEPVMAQAQQKVLRVVPQGEVKVFDPHQSQVNLTSMHAALVYDTLFSWDADMVAPPQMVERWTVSDDRLLYTFTLRSGLKFNDGSPVTTRDVIATLKRFFLRDSQIQSLAQRVATLESIDDGTFTIGLKEPFRFVEFLLGGSNGIADAIMREKEAITDPYTRSPRSSDRGHSASSRSEYLPGAKLVYEKNPFYVARSEPASGFSGRKLVKVDRVEFIIIPDATVAIAALRNGEVDFIDAPSLDVVPTVANDPNIVVREVWPIETCAVLRPNSIQPPFNNVEARPALAYMSDQREYMTAAYGDPKYWRKCYAYWVCGSPNGIEVGSEDFRHPNLEKARQLIIESGYKGEKVVLIGGADVPAYNTLTAHHSHPMAALWGDGTTSSSDDQYFRAGGRAGPGGAINAKYGIDPGAVLYTHVSGQYGPFHTKVLAATMSEAPYVLDGLHQHAHQTDLRIAEHYTDTAGATDHVFGLCHLLDFRFAPRIKDLKDRKLYAIEKPGTYPMLEPLIGDMVDTAAVVSQWAVLMRLKASIQAGTVMPSVILRKLAAAGAGNALSRALRALGRIERTLFTLQWLSDPNLRQRSHAGLNKGEASNSLRRAVFFHRQGEIRDRTFENQSFRASGLSLITAAIVHWNTVYLDRAVQHLRARGVITPDNLLVHVAPLGWEHIALTGDYIWNDSNPGTGFRPLRDVHAAFPPQAA